MFMGDSSLAQLVVERVTMAINTDAKSRDPEVIAGDFRVIDDDAEKIEPTDKEKEIKAPYDRMASSRDGWVTKGV
jgi:hypothetical protein